MYNKKKTDVCCSVRNSDGTADLEKSPKVDSEEQQ